MVHSFFSFFLSRVIQPVDFADLTSDQVKAEAKHGWLTDEQYLAILFNAEYYGDLITDPPFEEEPSKRSYLSFSIFVLLFCSMFV